MPNLSTFFFPHSHGTSYPCPHATLSFILNLFHFLLALLLSPTFASLSGNGISLYFSLSSCASFFISFHESLGSPVFFSPFLQLLPPYFLFFSFFFFVLEVGSYTLILKSTISVFWYFSDHWDFLLLSSLHMVLVPPLSLPSKAKWTALMGPDDVSQPLAWNW